MRVAIAVALVIMLIPYMWRADVRKRTTELNKCHTERSRADNGRYTATYCYGPGEDVVLRLYRSSSMNLLAERLFSYPRDEPVRLTWNRDAVVYDTAASDGDGIITLPPSLIDRLRAKLP
ncbi:hypothetical protein KEC55_24245 [Burkholderia cepacia]|uniref:hypothetical protein n=1 Tax=Burkholderia cepacia TaxID=292 RepID=UPI00249F86C8|nr:hypothetical protein [Burkholderia cepacia]WGY70167.1 hypothetical protein KEC55_24245 [Burkholderia cepacia]